MGVQQLHMVVSLARNSKITAIPCYWRSFNTLRALMFVVSIFFSFLTAIISLGTRLIKSTHRLIVWHSQGIIACNWCSLL